MQKIDLAIIRNQLLKDNNEYKKGTPEYVGYYNGVLDFYNKLIKQFSPKKEKEICSASS